MGAYSATPDSLARFGGVRERGGEGKGKGNRKGEMREGRGKVGPKAKILNSALREHELEICFYASVRHRYVRRRHYVFGLCIRACVRPGVRREKVVLHDILVYKLIDGISPNFG